MNFADSTLLRLSSEPGRNALLGQDELADMVGTAFDAPNAGLQGAYGLSVDRLDIGIEIARTAHIDGSYTATPGALPGDIRLRIANLQLGEPLRIDTLWRGHLIARHRPQDDRIVAVAGGFTLLDLDREIISDLGSLPAGAALENERRQRLLERLRTDAAQPNLIDDHVLDSILDASGAPDIAALLDAKGTGEVARLRLSFDAPAVAGAPVPIRLPITAAVLVRDA
ncbi:MAG: hypothetical protein WCY11_02920, partial [Novosphingobium sp.]